MTDHYASTPHERPGASRLQRLAEQSRALREQVDDARIRMASQRVTGHSDGVEITAALDGRPLAVHITQPLPAGADRERLQCAVLASLQDLTDQAGRLTQDLMDGIRAETRRIS